MAHAEMGVKMQWAETASQGKRQPKQAGSTPSNSCTCQETSLELQAITQPGKQEQSHTAHFRLGKTENQ